MTRLDSSTEFTWHDDVMHAFNEAMDCLDNWEVDTGSRELNERQSKAAEFVRKKIQLMAKRYNMANRLK